jgi:hypothetical protein
MGPADDHQVFGCCDGRRLAWLPLAINRKVKCRSMVAAIAWIYQLFTFANLTAYGSAGARKSIDLIGAKKVISSQLHVVASFKARV